MMYVRVFILRTVWTNVLSHFVMHSLSSVNFDFTAEVASFPVVLSSHPQKDFFVSIRQCAEGVAELQPSVGNTPVRY